jgi:phage shock protein C
MISGVMGGLGEFFGVDPVLLRLGYLILTVFSGFFPGIVGYVLAILIVPEAPVIAVSTPETRDTSADDAEAV